MSEIQIERGEVRMAEIRCIVDKFEPDDDALTWYWAWPVVGDAPADSFIGDYQRVWFRVGDGGIDRAATHVAVNRSNGERRVYTVADTWHPTESARLGMWSD